MKLKMLVLTKCYDMIDYIKKQIDESIRIKSELLSDEGLLCTINEVSKVIITALKSGHKVMWAGNGAILERRKTQN